MTQRPTTHSTTTRRSGRRLPFLLALVSAVAVPVVSSVGSGVSAANFTYKSSSDVSASEPAVRTGSGFKPAAAPPSNAAPSGGGCSNSVPAGTTFGTSISAVGQSAEESLQQNDRRFGELGVVRDYFKGLPRVWSTPRMQMHADRDLVVSFYITPQSVLSGKHDAFFKKWFADAPAERTVYWSFHHEPEGEVKAGQFTPAQYRNAWKRLDRFADAACKPNMHATLILSAWTARPQANPNYTAFDAGPDVIDVLAFDPYNRIFQANSTAYDSAEKILGPIVDVKRQDGRPVGVAELGSRIMRGDSNGSGRAQWLRNMGNYAIDNGITFVSYFQSTRGADWHLTDSRSIAAWSTFVKNSPR